MQGILLSGGLGKRLGPLTTSASKQLLPVYDKPLVYYPLSTMLLSGVTEICLVTCPENLLAHEKLLGDGSKWGVRIKYALQRKPLGIPDAFNCASDKLDTTKPCVLMLGDNFFYGVGLGRNLFSDLDASHAACFGFEVSNPQEYGVAKFDLSGGIVEIIEKPTVPPSNMAITGLYRFPHDVFEITKSLKFSARGELEISDLLNFYIAKRKLRVKSIDRGTAWLDTGTPRALINAGHFVQVMQERQGLMIGSPDEVAWRLGLIDNEQLKINTREFLGSNYGKSLEALLRDK